MVRTAKNHTLRVHRHGVALTQAERTGAIRVGWNDAAWGLPRHAIRDRLALFYELGYVGGLEFRRRKSRDGRA